MEIDLDVALRVPQRRDLMHPVTVIALVVIIEGLRFPSAGQQVALAGVDPRARHQDVEVAQLPPARQR